jgi:hypothetical protein
MDISLYWFPYCSHYFQHWHFGTESTNLLTDSQDKFYKPRIDPLKSQPLTHHHLSLSPLSLNAPYGRHGSPEPPSVRRRSSLRSRRRCPPLPARAFGQRPRRWVTALGNSAEDQRPERCRSVQGGPGVGTDWRQLG